MAGSDRCSTHLGRSVHRAAIELDDELVEGLLAMLRAGNYDVIACRAVGLSPRTFQHWCQRGTSTAARDEHYRVFRAKVEQARATGEARNVAAIASAARESWQAAAWMLERAYPERWARPSQRGDDAPAPTKSVDPGDPFAEVDELAERRGQRGA